MGVFEDGGHDVFERSHRFGAYEGYGGELPDPTLCMIPKRAIREGYRAGFRLGQLEREEKQRRRTTS